jgi:hypothetical protein
MKDKFLQKIKFDTIYNDYATKNYEETNERGYDYFRKLMFERVKEQEGYIVGSTFKFDGLYCEGTPPNHYDYEGNSPIFKATKRIDMWVIVTGMNEEYLVPKKPVEEDRFVTLEQNELPSVVEENIFPWEG